MDDIKLVENEEFVSKFKTMFFKKIYNFMKKYDIPNTNIVFCKDCPRKSIWRIPELPEYKATRQKVNHICDFFRIMYKEIIPKFICEGGHMMAVDNAEADDVVAICTKYFKPQCPKILIITSDHDYFQLYDTTVILRDMADRDITTKSLGNPKLDLLCKILRGDRSDNIKPVFKRCGIKNILKYYENPDILQTKLLEKNKLELFEKNRRLIDFNYMPELIKSEIMEKCKTLL